MNRIIAVALSLLLMACSGQESPSPVTVNTEGNHYHNAFFGVSVDKPEGWYSQSPEETIALQQRGTDMLAGDEKGMRAMIEASLKQSVPLFGFFEVPPGTPDKLNPNVVAAAENLTAFPGIKTGCDYLDQVKQMLEQGRMAYRFEEKCGTREFAGKSMNVIEGTVEMGELTITQRYYATIKGRHAVAVVQTWFSDEAGEQTGRIIDSLVIE